MNSLDYYLSAADEFIRQDADKNVMQAPMDAMWQASWRLPEEVTAQVFYLPHQIRAVSAAGGNTAGLRANRQRIPLLYSIYQSG